MQLAKDTFCSFCGAAFPAPLVYPRTCAKCRITIWSNPTPVCVVLVPIATGARTGLLVVRRGIEPGKGKLALVGGFLESHESWQDGAVREVREETGIHVGTPTPFFYASSSPNPNRVLLFSVVPPIAAHAVKPFVPNPETAERGIIHGPEGLDDLFAFSLHIDALRRWFMERHMTGDHAYALL